MSADGGVNGHPKENASWLGRVGGNIGAGFATVICRPAPDARRQTWPHIIAVASWTLAVIAVLIASMLWMDDALISAVGRMPEWLIRGFDSITDFGKAGWFLWPIGLFLLAMAAIAARDLPEMTRRVLAALAVRLGFVFVAIALPGLIVTVLKRVIGRGRPLVDSDGGVFAFKPLVWQVDYASIPSGHATTAFAAALAIGAVWPWLRPVVWVYAVLIGVSRVVLTAHYPSDIIAGAVFGVVGAVLVRRWFAARGLGFAIAIDGTVHSMPGPSWRRTKAVARRLLSA
jgi:undecaprenyl-diphosphatase